MKIILFKSKDDISRINDLIHDMNFNIDELIFDKNEMKLSIPWFILDEDKIIMEKKGFLFNKYRIPIIKAHLIIKNVKNFILTDTEKITYYSFNEILYDIKMNKISILSSVPLKFEIFVNEFLIEIIITNEIVKEKTYKVLNFFSSKKNN